MNVEEKLNELIKQIERDNPVLKTFPFNYECGYDLELPRSKRRPLSAAEQHLIDTCTYNFDDAT